VWIESVKDSDMAEVTYIESRGKAEVPIYKLVENSPTVC